MKNYTKPQIIINENEAEGVYTASGDGTKCTYGRGEYNPGSDTCQICQGQEHNHGNMLDQCPQGMPKKA